jgi:predicted aspartyl protease
LLSAWHSARFGYTELVVPDERRARMKSIADQLPPEIARQIHPDWRKNETAYWAVRDQLLGEYEGQWIGYADGAVIAFGTSPVTVFHAAEASARHPFVTCVGKEDEPCRMLRATFPYNTSYPGEPLPVVSIELRPVSGSPGVVLDQVIADTGADASAIPWTDCERLQLDPSRGRPIQMTGMAGGTAVTLLFRAWVYLDGQEYPCRLQADFVGHERILGRDVLNRLEVVFHGPAGEIIVNS